MSFFGEWLSGLLSALLSGKDSSGSSESTPVSLPTKPERTMSSVRATADVDPLDYEESFDGFKQYIKAIGAERVTAEELLKPHNRSVADDLGYQWLLPKREMWKHLVPLIDMFELVRDAVDAPIYVRNWWRPGDYNAQVGGAAGSDHITAHAFDCDFQTSDHRRIAEKILEDLQDDRRDLQISLGLGDKTIHIGAMSPRGRRTWKYSSYKQ